MRIDKTTAYIVNLSDQKGDRLLYRKDVEDIINNKIGEVVDALGIHYTDKLRVHATLKKNLAFLSHIHKLCELLKDADYEGPFGD